MTYDAKYFHRFFSRIPEERWTTAACKRPDGTCCAIGHLGNESMKNMNKKALALAKCLKRLNSRLPLLPDEEIIYNVNDGLNECDELGCTPKERMLKALELIQKGQPK